MESPLVIEFHYIFEEENLHEMDARIHNECEKQLIQAIGSLKKYCGDLEVKVSAKEKGSIVDIMQIVLTNGAFQNAFSLLLGVFINRWFSSNKDQKNNLQLDNSIKKAELIEKIKSGDFTPEEADMIVGADSELRKWKSEYYKKLQKDGSVVAVESKGRKKQKVLFCSRIRQSEFSSHIINDEILERSETIEGTSIRIHSPALQKGKGVRNDWQGLWNNDVITFKIDDKSFLNQVHMNEIKFGSSTLIKCTLKISRKYEGEQIKSISYTVLDVSNWDDDETFRNETKRYKKIKESKNQLTMKFD